MSTVGVWASGIEPSTFWFGFRQPCTLFFFPLGSTSAAQGSHAIVSKDRKWIVVHTLVFAHEGSLEVVRHALPHADRFGVILVHHPWLLVKAVVPGTRKRIQVRKRRRERWSEREYTWEGGVSEMERWRESTCEKEEIERWRESRNKKEDRRGKERENMWDGGERERERETGHGVGREGKQRLLRDWKERGREGDQRVSAVERSKIDRQRQTKREYLKGCVYRPQKSSKQQK